jgi:transcriptional antiterminator RfaH
MNPASNRADSLWYGVRTQTKREHIAAQHLRSLEDIEVFCPRIRYRKATRRGKVWWVEPMFPGYLLARFRLESMERAVTFTQGVRGLVRFGEEIPPIPTAFVEAIRRETIVQSSSGQSEDPECVTLTPEIISGDEIEVAHGPLQGMHGTILQILPAAERVKILLEFFGRPNIIEVDLFSLILPRKPVPKTNQSDKG